MKEMENILYFSFVHLNNDLTRVVCVITQLQWEKIPENILRNKSKLYILQISF